MRMHTFSAILKTLKENNIVAPSLKLKQCVFIRNFVLKSFVLIKRILGYLKK